VFAIEERGAARDRLLEMAKADGRVVGAAVVGSLSVGSGDRWSDLDLTFAVSDEAEVHPVLTDWTRQLVTDLDAVVLFDLPSGHTIYRVFLLPRCLQVDLSFTHAARFRPRGSGFGCSSAVPERSRRLIRPIRAICSAGRWSTRVQRGLHRAGTMVAGRALHRRHPRSDPAPGMHQAQPREYPWPRLRRSAADRPRSPAAHAGVVVGAGGAAGSADGLCRRAASRGGRSGRARNKGGSKACASG